MSLVAPGLAPSLCVLPFSQTTAAAAPGPFGSGSHRSGNFGVSVRAFAVEKREMDGFGRVCHFASRQEWLRAWARALAEAPPTNTRNRALTRSHPSAITLCSPGALIRGRLVIAA